MPYRLCMWWWWGNERNANKKRVKIRWMEHGKWRWWWCNCRISSIAMQFAYILMQSQMGHCYSVAVGLPECTTGQWVTIKWPVTDHHPHLRIANYFILFFFSCHRGFRVLVSVCCPPQQIYKMIGRNHVDLEFIFSIECARRRHSTTAPIAVAAAAAGAVGCVRDNKIP